MTEARQIGDCILHLRPKDSKQNVQIKDLIPNSVCPWAMWMRLLMALAIEVWEGYGAHRALAE